MTTATKPEPLVLPDGQTADDVMKCVVTQLAKSPPKGSRAATFPLWSVVKELTGMGSGYSCRICRHYGCDPDAQVRWPFR